MLLAMGRINRRVTENIAGDLADHSIKRAPAAPTTQGSLHQPMQQGTEIDGGVRQRLTASRK